MMRHLNGHRRFARGVGVIGLVAGLCGPSAPAAAAPASPIEIRACSPVFAANANSPYALGFQTRSGTQITFINHADVPAGQIEFQLGDAPNATTVSDRGTFAPGVPIRAVFDTPPDIPTVCRVARIRFADHTVYAANSEPNRPL